MMVEYESGTGYTSFADCGECNGSGAKPKTETREMATATEPACPKCAGVMYNNVAENDARLAKGEKLRPDFKCKNKSCDGVIWRPKTAAKPAYNQTARQPISHGPTMPWEEEQQQTERRFVDKVQAGDTSIEWVNVREKYVDTLQWVLENVEPVLAHVNAPTVAELLAATATLYIERNKKGC